MISRVFVDNYKCFSNSEILLPAGNVLVSGANGSGKTTFFDVLHILRDIICFGADVNSDVHLLGDTYTRWKRQDGMKTQRFELDIDGNGGRYRYELVVDNGGKHWSSRILSESLLYCNKPLFNYEHSNVHLFDNDTYQEKVVFRIKECGKISRACARLSLAFRIDKSVLSDTRISRSLQ